MLRDLLGDAKCRVSSSRLVLMNRQWHTNRPGSSPKGHRQAKREVRERGCMAEQRRDGRRGRDRRRADGRNGKEARDRESRVTLLRTQAD